MKEKIYKLQVNRIFPRTHERDGQPTLFVPKILIGIGKIAVPSESTPKIHAIRSDYSLWSKCMKEVQNGRAVIELFYWEEKPYTSKQVVFCNN